METDNRRVDAKKVAATTAVAELPWRESVLKLLVQQTNEFLPVEAIHKPSHQPAAAAGRATPNVIPVAAQPSSTPLAAS